MDLFELLFIALFILFPVLEGILRQRKKGQQGGPPGPSGRTGRPGEAGTDRPEAADEDRAASEMLPDDLWELMTGEKRRPQDGPAPEPEQAGTPWSVETGGASGAGTAMETSTDRSEPWAVDDEATAPEPVSLEYEGPEAYSLETPAPEPIERTVPSPKARHRAFHDLIDRPKRKPKRHATGLVRSLRSPKGLRQAVLFREILGPPKGLE